MLVTMQEEITIVGIENNYERNVLMNLEKKISEDMIKYMKEKNNFALSVVRMVKSALQLESIAKKKELTDEDVIAVISKQIKMRKDSIIEFEKGNRNDLVDKTNEEIKILMTYMPEQLSEEEIKSIINLVFETVKPQSPKDMGLIMREITPKIKGKADMAYVNNLIKEKLNNL